MVENVGRKVILIAVLLIVSIGLLTVPDRPFRMGLDLQGGSRLVYRFDFEEARRQGLISESESEADVIRQTIDIIRNRVDPSGVLEAMIRQEGTDRVVIELPMISEISGAQAGSTLGVALSADGRVIELDEADSTAASGFPQSGGVVQVGSEKMRYERRDGTRLRGVTRAYQGTPGAEHGAGENVTLVSDDAIRNAIENLGELAFLIVAEPADYTGTGTDQVQEEQRLREWLDANPGERISSFNSVPRENGGPHERISWFAARVQEGAEDPGEYERKMDLLRPSSQELDFTGQDLGRVFPSQDQLGYPAVGFEMKDTRKSAFGRFTGDNVNRNMAIVLNNEVVSFPNINQALTGSAVIEGRFKAEQVRELVTVLRSGSLRIKPILVSDERVGPTLGADYVNKGFYSGLIGLAAVLAFMIFYYRKLGVFAAISLMASMLMLMGGLAFLQATLTLPGIAGIILTVGMAVDANILIFDRIREEMDKGRNIKQATRNGFDRALVTIVDANLTTLITALILYKVGTGPVRGFAVTLSIGIVSSVFAALVITRVLVHFMMQRKGARISMGTWLVEANWKFLSRAKLAIAGSIILIIAGLALFISIPNEQKLGIDFLGGATVQFRTEQPQKVETMRDMVAKIPGDIGSTAEIKPVLNSSAGSGTYTEFRATSKIGGDSDDGGNQGDTFENEIRTHLGSVLQRGPIEASLTDNADGTKQADLKLYFEEQHGTADLVAQLTEVGLREPDVQAVADRKNTYSVNAGTSAATSALGLKTRIQEQFSGTSDADGREYVLALPVPESSLVGKQVVGELRDKAILALFISLFAIVMYIRVRFAEYSYGFAAVIAVLHDVLITLGVLAVAMKTGLVQVEISLALIAAFLTIIGYSLNDTIVLFDRVRENLPRMKVPMADVLDTSINQTLSRTILTSITTFMAVAILFGVNYGTGNVIEGFSFAMLIGVIVGTYSSIYVASPVLLWLETRRLAKESSHGGGSESKGSGKDKSDRPAKAQAAT